ncbi:MAG: PIG-L family deacetylase [Acidobacteriota bacterium]|nr:MAG: PIG-L family deacetylase [Acidobacteriota bacterium]
MKFNKATADFFVPDGIDPVSALDRTTHLTVGAHQDDIEIMAYHGIAQCFGRSDKWMTGVVVTNGAGSSRTGIYSDYTDLDMQKVRRFEQRKAAYVGEYSAQIQLDYSSSEVKDPSNTAVIDDLFKIFEAAKPQIVYLHNPADKHDTHIGTLVRAIAALRRLPLEDRPEKVYGCEVWRDLDWLPDANKTALAVSEFSNVAAALVGIFDSQISGGKRYDLATAGRRLANATYFDAHSSDNETAMTWALDLTPLIHDDTMSVAEFTLKFIDKFREDVESKIARLS